MPCEICNEPGAYYVNGDYLCDRCIRELDGDYSNESANEDEIDEDM